MGAKYFEPSWVHNPALHKINHLNTLYDMVYGIPELSVALHDPLIRSVPAAFDVRFKGERYTIIDMHSYSTKVSFVSMDLVGFSNYASESQFTAGIFFHPWTYGPITDEVKNKQKNELLQKLRKTLSDCYAAGIPFDEIQQTWDFELIRDVQEK